MSLFKKEKKSDATFQDVEQKFLEMQFELGKEYYMAHVRSEESNRHQDKANTIALEMVKLAQRGADLKKKIEAEVHSAVEKGKKNETTLN